MHKLATFDETCMGNILEYGYSTWWSITLVHIYIWYVGLSLEAWHVWVRMVGILFWWCVRVHEGFSGGAFDGIMISCVRSLFDLCGWWLEKKHKGCGYYVRKTETWLWYTMLKLFLGLFNSFVPISCIIQETKTISYMHAWLQPIKFEWPVDIV